MHKRLFDYVTPVIVRRVKLLSSCINLFQTPVGLAIQNVKAAFIEFEHHEDLLRSHDKGVGCVSSQCVQFVHLKL